MTYGEDAHLLIPLLTGFFFLGCAWFASVHIKSSIMQVVMKYGSFFMALLAVLVSTANSSLSARWYVVNNANAINTNIVNNLSAWEIAIVVFTILALVVFIVLAFTEALTNWKQITNKHDKGDSWEMKSL